MQKKEEIPEEVINYCIDNKVSIVEGLQAIADSKIQSLEKNIASLKKDALDDIFSVKKDISSVEKLSKEDMDDVESFLDFLLFTDIKSFEFEFFIWLYMRCDFELFVFISGLYSFL